MSYSFAFGTRKPHTVMNSILSDQQLKTIAKSRDLVITKVTWEDTGRNHNSCWGRQISDMTLAVTSELCPVIRKDNFLDVTCDLPIEQFNVKVGNETGKEQLEVQSLKDYLSAIHSKKGPVNLIRARDSQIMVSSQACILPLEDGTVEFRPQLYNYPTRDDSPALLVVLSTSLGTTAQVVQNKPQDLVYNLNGKICHFLATRLRDDRKARGVALEGAMDKEEIERNLIAIYSVPLKQKPVATRSRGLQFHKGGGTLSACSSSFGGGAMLCAAAPGMAFPDSDEDECEIDECGEEMVLENASVDGCRGLKESKPKRGMDHAMLSITETKGKMTHAPQEYELERDEEYPIRLTLQRYRVTDSKDISPDTFTEIADVIASLYKKSDHVGSLVVDGPNKRVTESSGTSIPPKPVAGSLSVLF